MLLCLTFLIRSPESTEERQRPEDKEAKDCWTQHQPGKDQHLPRCHRFTGDLFVMDARKDQSLSQPSPSSGINLFQSSSSPAAGLADNSAQSVPHGPAINRPESENGNGSMDLTHLHRFMNHILTTMASFGHTMVDSYPPHATGVNAQPFRNSEAMKWYPKYEGESRIDVWLNNVEKRFGIRSMANDVTKIDCLLSLIEGKLLEWILSQDTDGNLQGPYNGAKQWLTDLFSGTIMDGIKIRLLLEREKQKDEESVTDYLKRKTKLFRNHGLPLDTSFCFNVMEGIRSKTVARQLRIYIEQPTFVASHFEELVGMVVRNFGDQSTPLSTNDHGTSIGNDVSGLDTPRSRYRSHSLPRTPATPDRDENVRSKCPEREPQDCLKCGKPGHWAFECHQPIDPRTRFNAGDALVCRRCYVNQSDPKDCHPGHFGLQPQSSTGVETPVLTPENYLLRQFMQVMANWKESVQPAAPRSIHIHMPPAESKPPVEGVSDLILNPEPPPPKKEERGKRIPFKLVRNADSDTVLVKIASCYDATPFDVFAMLDTHASVSFCPESLVEQFSLPYLELKQPTAVLLADGSTVTATKAVELNVTLFGHKVSLSCLVMKCPELTFGLDFHKNIFKSINHGDRVAKLRKAPNAKVPLASMHTRWELTSNLPATRFDEDRPLIQLHKQSQLDDLVLRTKETKFVNFICKKSINVPPNSVVRINVIPSHKFEQCQIVQNPKTTNVTGLIIQNQVQHPDQDFIMASNFNPFKVRILAGQHVADGQPIQAIQNYKVTFKGKSILKLLKTSPEELIPELSIQDKALEYMSCNYHKMVVNDFLRLSEKNKPNLELYPPEFNPKSPVCHRLMDYEDLDPDIKLNRFPDFVHDSSKIHPNKYPETSYEQFDFSLFNINCDGTTAIQQESMKQMLYQFRNMFAYSKHELGNLDRSKLPQIRIETKTDVPVSMMPYRRSPADRTIIEAMIKEMLECGIIRPSDSEYASPVVIVSKKDGTKRFCVDYKKLNDITVKDQYPLPLIADALDAVSGASWFTTLDMFNGYHLLPMHPDSVSKTAFTSHLGLFEYLVLPFGLSSAPAKFQRMVDRVLGRLKFRTCFIYLDDLICWAKDFNQHQSRLREILTTLDGVGLKLNPKKCFFMHFQLEYLGFIVSKEGIRPSPAKVEKVRKHAPPKNVKQIRQFLGLVGHFRSFIKDFAKLAYPLNQLLRADKKFSWTEKEQKAFETLRDSLCKEPIRTHFKEECEHEVHTDASGLGLGAVLLQKESDDNGKDTLKVVAYWARGLRDTEKRYEATELELLAVVEALEHFRTYLHGRRFTVVSDHQALLSLNKGTLSNSKHGNKRLIKWRLLLQDFDYDVRYKPGAQHFIPDALSRMDQEPTEGIEPDDERMFFTKAQFLSMINEELKESPDMKESQSKDPFCTQLWKKRNDPKKRKYFEKKFTVIEGLLYRKISTPIGQRFMVVVPDKMIQEVIKSSHDGDHGIHPGMNKTMNLILAKYWWPRLKEDVIEYVRRCKMCTMKKAARHGKPQPKPTYYSFPAVPGLRPFQFVCMDLIDLSNHRTKLKSGYIIVVSCYLTKYLVTGVLKSLRADEMQEWFARNICYRYSDPEVLVTDNGTNFRSQRMAKFCKAAGIKQRFIAPYHAQANGQVERMNSMVKKSLSFFVSGRHKDWDRYLQLVTYQLNCLTSRTTGVSPFYAVHFYHPRNKFDNSMNLPDLVPEGNPDNNDSHEKLWKTLWERVRKKAEKLRQRRPKSFLPKFQVGDKVVIMNHRPRTGLVKGFLDLYIGPYVITGLRIEDTYQVTNCEDVNDVRIVNVCEMKRYYCDDPLKIGFDFTPDVDEEEIEELPKDNEEEEYCPDFEQETTPGTAAVPSSSSPSSPSSSSTLPSDSPPPPPPSNKPPPPPPPIEPPPPILIRHPLRPREKRKVRFKEKESPVCITYDQSYQSPDKRNEPQPSTSCDTSGIEPIGSDDSSYDAIEPSALVSTSESGLKEKKRKKKEPGPKHPMTMRSRSRSSVLYNVLSYFLLRSQEREANPDG